MIGDAGAAEFLGNGGDDTFEGRGGADDVQRRLGFDKVVYNTTRNLVDGIGTVSTGGLAQGSQINADVEEVDGGSGNDSFRGSHRSAEVRRSRWHRHDVDYSDHPVATQASRSLARRRRRRDQRATA